MSPFTEVGRPVLCRVTEAGEAAGAGLQAVRVGAGAA